MGIYEIIMGKGIVVTNKIFASLFAKELDKLDEDDLMQPESIEEMINKRTLGNYMVKGMGHDAFRSRHGNMGVLDRTKNYEIVQKLKKSLECTTEPETNNLPELACGSPYIFIGFYEFLEGGEFDYYIGAPEVIYGLPALLDEIVELVPRLREKDCSEISNLFNQKACIWTFAQDCACCG